jgi:hypothetical protein
VARALPFRRLHTDPPDRHVIVLPSSPHALPRPRAILLLLALPFAAACGGDGSGLTLGKKTSTSAGAVDPELKGPVIVDVPKAPYKTGAVSAPGRVTGTVALASPIAPADPVPTGRDSTVCGRTVADSSVQQKGTGLGNVVVWLDGVRAGKALPEEKRIEVESNTCLLSPRVQATVTGSAVNVIGHDDFRQHLRFLAAGDTAARAAILLGKDEQVIPTELPAKSPGLVIIRDADHPWPRAYVAVFDHPYFAVTKPDGSFAIEGVPPGSYTLMAWHERTGRTEQPITIAANGAQKVTLTLKGK